MMQTLLSDDALCRWLAEETLALCAIPSATGDEAQITSHLSDRVRSLQPHAEQNGLATRCSCAVAKPNGPRIGLVWSFRHRAAQQRAQPHHIDWQTVGFTVWAQAT